ncbi:MAG: DUF2590 family protein [Methylobacter sp.]
MDYIDLRITDNDLTLGPGHEPALLGDRDSIIQDTKHLIRDCGLLSACIGERDNAQIALLLRKLELKIEDDLRLVPGTIKITRQGTETFFIDAMTVKFGPINLQVSA